MIVFNLECIECAKYKATFEEDTDLKAEIKYVKDEMGEIKNGINSLKKQYVIEQSQHTIGNFL